MKTLQECNWKEFRLSHLFQNRHGKRLCEKDRIKGNTPMLTAGESNNGVSSFISNSEMKTYSNFISIDMFGNSFYHMYEATGDDNIYFLINESLSAYTKLFVVQCINLQRCKYSYGKQFRQFNADNGLILLPVTPDGTPDWQYMEDYMREVEKKLQAQALPSLRAKAAQQSTQSNGTLEQQDWKEFALNDIFSIRATQSGIDRNKLVAGEGNTPYITRTDMNNGWDSFICEQPKYRQDEGNVISVGLDTQTVFYQPCSFYTGQNIQVFNSPQLNRYVAAFIIPLLKIQMQKFNWGGNGATLGRLKRSKILLPVTPDGTPDYAFMENYMRAVEAKQIRHYLDKKK